jgi:hypothetical protein
VLDAQDRYRLPNAIDVYRDRGELLPELGPWLGQ